VRTPSPKTTAVFPQWLEIKPTDDEKVVTRKKKLMKSYKSKIRFQNMDMTQKVKQDSWKNFQTGKGAKKKAGFFGEGQQHPVDAELYHSNTSCTSNTSTNNINR
jgi:hypothetical protein